MRDDQRVVSRFEVLEEAAGAGLLPVGQLHQRRVDAADREPGEFEAVLHRRDADGPGKRIVLAGFGSRVAVVDRGFAEPGGRS